MRVRKVDAAPVRSDDVEAPGRRALRIHVYDKVVDAAANLLVDLVVPLQQGPEVTFVGCYHRAAERVAVQHRPEVRCRVPRLLKRPRVNPDRPCPAHVSFPLHGVIRRLARRSERSDRAVRLCGTRLSAAILRSLARKPSTPLQLPGLVKTYLEPCFRDRQASASECMCRAATCETQAKLRQGSRTPVED